MRFTLSLSLIMLIALSCKNEADSNDTIYQDIDVIDESHYRVDIDYIKSISAKGFTSFDMSELSGRAEELKFIEESSTLRSFGQVNVNGFENWTINYYPYHEYRAYQWDDLGGSFAFTFFVQDEECCFSQYCCVTDDKGKVKSMNSFGTSGGDGGWSIETSAVLNHTGTYHIYEDETDMDHCLRNDSAFEIEKVWHKEYLLRFQDSSFVKGKIINESKDSTFYLY